MKRFIAYDSLGFSISLLVIFLCGGSKVLLLAQTRIKPSIHTTKLAENFYKILVHNFVNMLVFNGPDGALLVDTGCEPLDLIDAELKKIGVGKIKFIINTHSHDDHVGGNALFGREAVIISSHRCREVLLEDGNFPESGLPNLSFSDSMSIHFNDEEIDLYFMPGHSDNDLVVHFRKATIVCIGDFGFFKYGSVWPGFSANVYDMEESMIRMTERFSDNVLIICGHESEYTMQDLRLHSALIKEAINLVNPLIQQGLSLEQIKKRNPLKNSAFSIVRENSEKWLESIYNSRGHSNKK